MTNEEKFKTAKERYEEFDEFCNKHTCDNCPAGKVGSLESECAFNWLEFENEKELKPCPFCGNNARLLSGTECYEVICSNPDCAAIIARSFPSREEAITAWNRRAK